MELHFPPDFPGRVKARHLELVLKSSASLDLHFFFFFFPFLTELPSVRDILLNEDQQAVEHSK